MKQHYWLICFFLIFSSCSTCSVKEKMNKVSEKAGEAVGEVAKGVSRGVENSFEIHINKIDSTALESIELGKIQLSSKEGSDNVLSVYFIFKKDFSKKNIIKVFDKNGIEMGRSSEQVTGKKDEAKFTDFTFDKRTNIDSDSKIVME